MIKADDKEVYGEKEKGQFTNFEILKKKVEVLMEEIILISQILEQNKLVLVKELSPESDEGKIEDVVYRRLEAEK